MATRGLTPSSYRRGGPGGPDNGVRGERVQRLLVVTNPRSRQNRRDPALTERLRALVGGRGEVVAPTTPAELEDALRRARAEGVDLVAINGGDGTSHLVLTAMVTVWGEGLPPVTLLRGGTMNTIASGLGIRGRTEAVLRRLLANPDAPVVTRSLLRVDSEPPQYGFLFGNGLISNFLAVYYEGSEPSPAKAAWILARGVLSGFVQGALIRRLMARVRLQVGLDGEELPARDYLAIGAGTVDDIGLRFRPFHDAPSHPGRLHLLAIACSPLAFILQLPRIWLARPTRHPDIRPALVRRARLEADEPIAFMVDGDFHQGGRVLELSAGPTVRFVVP